MNFKKKRGNFKHDVKERTKGGKNVKKSKKKKKEANDVTRGTIYGKTDLHGRLRGRSMGTGLRDVPIRP